MGTENKTIPEKNQAENNAQDQKVTEKANLLVIIYFKLFIFYLSVSVKNKQFKLTER